MGRGGGFECEAEVYGWNLDAPDVPVQTVAQTCAEAYDAIRCTPLVMDQADGVRRDTFHNEEFAAKAYAALKARNVDVTLLDDNVTLIIRLKRVVLSPLLHNFSNS